MEAEKGSIQERQEEKVGSKDLLEKLREQLYSSNGSIRRQSGYNLSWMQEDGLEILKEALFGDSPVTTRNAAAYGMRNMRGRMKKMALEALREGLEHKNKAVREVCSRALMLLEEKKTQKQPPKKTEKTGTLRITDIPQKRKRTAKTLMEQNHRRRPPRK